MQIGTLRAGSLGAGIRLTPQRRRCDDRSLIGIGKPSEYRAVRTPPRRRPPLPSVRAWSPLRNALFRNLWIATIVSNVGTWMQDVGAGWLMTSLSSSPSMVALVEAADSMPVMLLALPAGALADIVDRRRLLIGVQIYLMIVVGVLWPS